MAETQNDNQTPGKAEAEGIGPKEEAPRTRSRRDKRHAHREAAKAKKQSLRQRIGRTGKDSDDSSKEAGAAPAPAPAGTVMDKDALAEHAAEHVNSMLADIYAILHEQIQALMLMPPAERNKRLEALPELYKAMPADLKPAIETLIKVTGQTGELVNVTRLAIALKLGAAPREPLDYCRMYQTKKINAVTAANKKRMNITPGTSMGVDMVNRVPVFLRNYDNPAIRCDTVTERIADLILRDTAARLPHNATAAQIERGRNGVITVREYMADCSLKSYPNSRQQLITGIVSLLGTGYIYNKIRVVKQGKKAYKEKRKGYVSLLISAEHPDADPEAEAIERVMHNGEIYYSVHPDICKIASKGRIAPFPAGMFKINIHDNPHSYGIEKWLCIYRNMNLTEANRNMTSIAAILKQVRSIPEIKDIDPRHLVDQIMIPVTRDLMALRRPGLGGIYGFVDWHFCLDDKRPIIDSDAANLPVSEWLKLKIFFELVDYPEQADAAEKIETGRGKRKADAEKRKKKKEEELEALPDIPEDGKDK